MHLFIMSNHIYPTKPLVALFVGHPAFNEELSPKSSGCDDDVTRMHFSGTKNEEEGEANLIASSAAIITCIVLPSRQQSVIKLYRNPALCSSESGRS